MSKEKPLLGVLGGLGPMSTFYFCELLTSHTRAKSDADHMDMLVSSRATTPDRTAFILGKSDENPLPAMKEEATRLTSGGADLIVIPCNTAHYFYDQLKDACAVPILNIAEETVRHLAACGVKKFGLLATEGTVFAGTYEKYARPLGLSCVTPDKEDQCVISSIIYDNVKQNKPVDLQKFQNVVTHLQEKGCEQIVLGCTELSLLKAQLPATAPVTDSLEVLAFRTILTCKKRPVGFPPSFQAEGKQ